MKKIELLGLIEKLSRGLDDQNKSIELCVSSIENIQQALSNRRTSESQSYWAATISEIKSLVFTFKDRLERVEQSIRNFDEAYVSMKTMLNELSKHKERGGEDAGTK